MQIAIPAMGRQGLLEKAADHFGRCDAYTVVDEKGKLLSVLDNDSVHGGRNRVSCGISQSAGNRYIALQGVGSSRSGAMPTTWHSCICCRWRYGSGTFYKMAKRIPFARDCG